MSEQDRADIEGYIAKIKEQAAYLQDGNDVEARKLDAELRALRSSSPWLGILINEFEDE